MPLEKRSPMRVRFFMRYARWFMRRNFHGVRLSKTGPLPEIPDGPLIIVLNHPSWWDPMMGMVLAYLLPEHKHFIPIEAKAIEQYKFFEKIGFFGIETGTTQGAKAFLQTSEKILAQPKTALWITAQGQFTDVRERPIKLMSGVGHLAKRLSQGTVLPLALEYPFWNERYPEALSRFGMPMTISNRESQSVTEWKKTIEVGLTETLDTLIAESLKRDPSLFTDLATGSAGIGGVYDIWRRLKSWLTFKRFDPAHGKSS